MRTYTRQPSLFGLTCQFCGQPLTPMDMLSTFKRAHGRCLDQHDQTAAHYEEAVRRATLNLTVTPEEKDLLRDIAACGPLSTGEQVTIRQRVIDGVIREKEHAYHLALYTMAFDLVVEGTIITRLDRDRLELLRKQWGLSDIESRGTELRRLTVRD